MLSDQQRHRLAEAWEARGYSFDAKYLLADLELADETALRKEGLQIQQRRGDSLGAGS